MVFVMLLMFGFGCTKETKVVLTPAVEQKETDNKTSEVKSQILVPWDEKRKNFGFQYTLLECLLTQT